MDDFAKSYNYRSVMNGDLINKAHLLSKMSNEDLSKEQQKAILEYAKNNYSFMEDVETPVENVNPDMTNNEAPELMKRPQFKEKYKDTYANNKEFRAAWRHYKET
jgi:hypothetical protein